MKDNIFVNSAFTSAVQTYINVKQNPEDSAFWSFKVMVIRSLIAIYGELDIINPYRTNNEDHMGGLDDNLTKFGFSKTALKHFKDCLQNYEIAKQNHVFPNQNFMMIEKYLIDMFFARQKHVPTTPEEQQTFQSLLYLSTTKNPIMITEIQTATNNVQALDHYWNGKVFLNNHNFELVPYHQNLLPKDAYNVLGYTEESIGAMDEKTLSELNNSILNFFKIDPNEQNKMKRLQEAVSYYKQFGNRITSGNGYVDMLMLLSIIATVMMSLFVITVKVLGG